MTLLTALVLTVVASLMQSEVKLPLADYLSLVETAENVEREVARASLQSEPMIAELVSQHASIVWSGEVAEVRARYEVELRGEPPRPVALPVTGLVWDARIQPAGEASLQLTEGGLRFVTSTPGRYTIQVSASASPELEDGISRLRLAPLVAPVGDFEIRLPEALLFRCPGAVIADDVVQDGSRTLRFALPRGKPAVVEVQQDVAGAEADELLAAADLVTIVELGPDGLRRHDLIVYEVSRGQIETLEVTVPEGMVVQRALTDEGEAPVVMEAGSLRVERTRKLDRKGFLRLSSHASNLDEVSLDPVFPRTLVRARYLALSASISAESEVLPEKSWLRIDVDDFPEALFAAASEFRLQAAWRLVESPTELAMKLEVRPEARRLESLVHRRESLSLLTIENRLLHRDVFEVATGQSTFRLRMSSTSTLWSVRVNDEMVRPVQRGAETLVPLGLGAAGDIELVEIISVQDQELPKSRAELVLALPEVADPVLVHTWKLLLPGTNRYRFVRGELEPVAGSTAARSVSSFNNAPVAYSTSSDARISGEARDPEGNVLPGVTVTAESETTGQTRATVTDVTGRFRLAALPVGRYGLSAELPGFQTARYEGISLSSGQDQFFTLRLDLAGVEETVTVTAETPSLTADPVFRTSSVRRDHRSRPAKPRIDEEAKARSAFAQEVLRLRGLVGGVKPIQVAIPESGKLLALGAALPPSTVRVVLDVKPE